MRRREESRVEQPAQVGNDAFDRYEEEQGSLSRAKKRDSKGSLTAKNTFVPKEIKIESGIENLVVMEQVDMLRLKRIEVLSCKEEYDNLRQTGMEIIQTKPLFVHGSGLGQGCNMPENGLCAVQTAVWCAAKQEKSTDRGDKGKPSSTKIDVSNL